MSTPSDIITRCPQCAIAFKATAQVLKIANGNVRCGSCLSVFNAASHAVDRPATPSNKNSNKNKEEDESWALDLLANEEQNSDSDTEFDIDLDADDQQDTDENQSLLLDIINNDLHNDQATKKKETSSPIDNDIHIDLEAELGTTFTPSEDLLLDAETNPDLTPESDSHLALNVETLNNDNDHLDSITLQYDNTSPKRWPWFLGTLGLLALLLAQIAWLRFDTLSTQAHYRTYYSKACEALGCTLPTRSDLSQIRTSHLVISSHPEENNILVANAIIVNNASFEQAFPALQLEFRNINNELIARRDFQPAEYLKGELINATIMPATHAVQLALAVVDPGESAINYRINIVPAKP